jgi:hypothetical protein
LSLHPDCILVSPLTATRPQQASQRGRPQQSDMLWTIQTRLLCAFFGAWSDDPTLKEEAILEQAVMVNVGAYRLPFAAGN